MAANPFDQFDAAPVAGGNPFDQFDGAPPTESYEQAVASPEGQKLKGELTNKAQQMLLKQEGREGAFNAGADAFLNSFGLNIPRNITAGARSLREGIPFKDAYNIERDISEASRAQHPGTSLAMELAGGLGQAALLPEIKAAGVLGPGAGLLERGAQVVPKVLNNPAGGAAVQGGVTSGLSTLFDTKDAGEAARAAGTGAVIGGAAGKVLAPAAASIAKKLENLAAGGKKIPTAEELEKGATALYDAADASGVAVKTAPFKTLAADLVQKFHERGVPLKDLRGRYKNFMDQVMDAGRDDMSGIPRVTTLRGVDTIRQALSDARRDGSAKAAGNYKEIKQVFDEWLGGLSDDAFAHNPLVDPQQVVGMQKDARKYWHWKSKSETIEDAIENAKVDADISRGGDEDTLMRRAMGNLWKENRKINYAGFTPDEMEALRGVAQGGFTRNSLRNLGFFSPDNGYRAFAELAPGALLWAAGSPHALPVFATGLAAAGVGGAAKHLAARGTRKAAEGAAELMRAGGTNEAAGRVMPRDVQRAAKSVTGSITALDNAPSPEEMQAVEGVAPQGAREFRGGQGGKSPRATQIGVDLPKVGDIKKGYRYIGGEPHDRNSWEKVQ